jgi:hypothetical protein
MFSDHRHFGIFLCHLNRRERKIVFSPFNLEAILLIDPLEARKRDQGKCKRKTWGLEIIVMFCHIDFDSAVFVGFANSVDDGTCHPGKSSEAAKRVRQVGHYIEEQAKETAVKTSA